MTAQPQTILILDLAKYFGGTDVRVIELARALHPQHRVLVATLQDSPVQQRLKAEGLPVLPIPYRRSDPRLALSIARIIREHRCTVVDAHNPQAQFWGHLGSVLVRGVRRVSTVHSAYRLEHGGRLKGRLYEQVLQFNRLLGCQFVAVTEAVEAYLRGIGIPPERIRLIHNSLALPAEPDTTAARALFEGLGWDRETYVVSIVARLEPVKEHATLIEAMRQVVPQFPQLRCLIIGDGRRREALEAQVRAAGLEQHVHFAGFREDIPALLMLSSAFCLPSSSEALPYALLEAALCRLPLLVSEVGGMAGLLRHQETGYFVPPADAGALAEGLRWLLTHPEQAAAMGQAAHDLVRHQFDPAVTLQQTLDVYGLC